MAAKKNSEKKKSISIYTIAEALGVTPGTVSRALNNRPEISVATRKLVRQKAGELGFKLRSFEPRVTNICMVIEVTPNQTSLFSPFVDSVLDGVWKYCKENDMELSLFGEKPDRLNECDLIRVLGRRSVNGAVFLNSTRQSRYFAALNDQNFPYCCVLSGAPEAAQWTVLSDGAGLSRRATKHLIDLGHRSIGFLDTLSGLEIGAERRAGFEAALKAEGLPVLPELFFSHANSGDEIADGFEFGARGVQFLLSRKVVPTAFMTMSDEVAFGAMHELVARGHRVPADFSVLSFDDSKFCQYANPPLTVVSQPNERFGYEAARLVARRIDENLRSNPFPPLAIAGELIVRGSTGPVPRVH
ncbi:MAG: LacI family DNA-binding transcriptional regulator [Akkermansiaceae bacterium]